MLNQSFRLFGLQVLGKFDKSVISPLHVLNWHFKEFKLYTLSIKVQIWLHIDHILFFHLITPVIYPPTQLYEYFCWSSTM